MCTKPRCIATLLLAAGLVGCGEGTPVGVGPPDGRPSIGPPPGVVVPPGAGPPPICAAFPTFEDANLEAAVRAALGIGALDRITCRLLGTLTSLVARDAGIVSLVGIENLTNLTLLDLRFNGGITDISPVGGLTALTNLDLDRNHLITDISPLSGLVNLTDLGLDASDGLGRIRDISVLSGLTKLTNLGIRGHRITDVTPLAGLTDLIGLNLASNLLIDISPLSGLTNLQFLAINRNGAISDISPLAGLTNLAGTLWLNNNRIADLTPLSGLTGVTTLRVNDNQITDLTSLRTLTNLTSIQIRGNPYLSDIQPLLDNVDLGGSPTIDLRVTSVACTDVDLLAAKGVTVSSDCAGLPPQAGVAVQDNYFFPTQAISPGGTVTWLWSDQNENDHNVTFSSGPNSATQASGTFSRAFAASGIYDYTCTIHGPAMSGTIMVK